MKTRNVKRGIAHGIASVVAIAGCAAFSGGLLACEDAKSAAATTLREPVTGSHIVRPAGSSSQALIELDRKYIEQSGATNSFDLIRTVPVMRNSAGRAPALGAPSGRSSR